MSDELVEEDDVEFEPGILLTAQHTEVPERILNAVQDASDTIGALTTDEFLAEAYTGATMLLHLLGDADGLVADQAQNIRSSILVVATEIHKDPIGFLFAALRTIPDFDAQIQLCTEAMDRLDRYRHAIANS